VEGCYYRQEQALRHDIDTIRSNAELFNGEGSRTAESVALMAEALLAALDGRPLPEIALPRGGYAGVRQISSQEMSSPIGA
jgi:hypothetical protein